MSSSGAWLPASRVAEACDAAIHALQARKKTIFDEAVSVEYHSGKRHLWQDGLYCFLFGRSLTWAEAEKRVAETPFHQGWTRIEWCNIDISDIKQIKVLAEGALSLVPTGKVFVSDEDFWRIRNHFKGDV